MQMSKIDQRVAHRCMVFLVMSKHIIIPIFPNFSNDSSNRKSQLSFFLVSMSGMLWTGGSVSGSVRDVCISHQSDWIYY